MSSNTDLTPDESTALKMLNAWKKDFLKVVEGRTWKRLTKVISEEELIEALYWYTFPLPQIKKKEKQRISSRLALVVKTLRDTIQTLQAIGHDPSHAGAVTAAESAVRMYAARVVLQSPSLELQYKSACVTPSNLLTILLSVYMQRLAKYRKEFLSKASSKFKHRDEGQLVGLVLRIQRNTYDKGHKDLALVLTAAHKAHGNDIELSAQAIQKIVARFRKAHQEDYEMILALTPEGPPNETIYSKKAYSKGLKRLKRADLP